MVGAVPGRGLVGRGLGRMKVGNCSVERSMLGLGIGVEGDQNNLIGHGASRGAVQRRSYISARGAGDTYLTLLAVTSKMPVASELTSKSP